MKHLLTVFFIAIGIVSIAQNNIKTYEITYGNGERNIKIYYQNDILFLSGPKSKIAQYTNFNEKVNISLISSNDSIYKLSNKLSELSEPLMIKEKTKVKILGFKCKYAEYSYFSNKIEVWYTEKANVRGSLYSNYLPSAKSLVLKIKVNGSDRFEATNIRKLDTIKFKYLGKNAKEVNEARFEELKINSRYTKLQIFENDTINFDPSRKITPYDELANDVVYHFSRGTIVMKKIKLTAELKTNNQVFARLTNKSNGDAYDRTGSVFIIPASKTHTILNACTDGLEQLPVYIDNDSNSFQGIRKEGDYEPAIEVMRFFTSFGVNHFNDKRPINNYPWADEVVYKQEVSSLIPNTEDEVWVGVFIGNYDKGGHIISLELDIYPAWDEEDTTVVNYIQPLFSTVNILEASGQNYGILFDNDTLRVDFELPDSISDLNLLFTTTGHGGWGEGDEFVPKLNQVIIDGKIVFSIVPWRTDCATYRLSNPASGNFSNGLSSSDLSRSNWCPATLTPPYIIPLKELKSGNHKIKIIIDQGKKSDDGSSAWSVSGILTGKIKHHE